MGDDGASATSSPAPVADAAADSGYPPLQSVPPRPQLSYTIQQQRQIVEALIADRENARYTSQVVRHRSGVSSLPPPPTPPEPAPAVTIEPDVASPQATGRERPLADQETLLDFLAALLFDEPEEPVSATDPEEVSPPAPEVPDSSDEPKPASSAGATSPKSERTTGRAPVPPARSAVAARVAAGPGVIDELVDKTVPQMPLPPGQSALAARLAPAGQIDSDAPPAAPLPAARPTTARSAAVALRGTRPDPASLPEPPPTKPVLPASAAMPPKPAARPGDDRSASAQGVRLMETIPTIPFVGTQVPSIVANPMS
jgi:hypothetical protein